MSELTIDRSWKIQITKSAIPVILLHITCPNRFIRSSDQSDPMILRDDTNCYRCGREVPEKVLFMYRLMKL